uniref:Flavin-containing monooxygenase n=2 Tax=Rhodnius prolixus TaxID=13249 RepID=A0A4P6D8U9_RHOPR
MMFPDFPHTNKQGVSYLSAKEVLQYLNDYADHFNIHPFVKLRHHVKKISPMGTQWKIEVIELEANREHTYMFDAVIVCNGHNSKPRFAKIKGIEYFKGRQLHSHNYREAEVFRGLRTLVVGAGPSGLDMTFELATVTDTVVLSHHTDYASKVGFPPKVILKPDLDRVTPDGSVMFKDGSLMEFDLIIHCTGYLYTYPFLAKECDITVEDNYVSPLYKSVININHPTMAFLAILKHTPTFYVTDLQVRYFLHTFCNPSLLPSKQEMEAELLSKEHLKAEKGLRKCDYHMVGDDNVEYIDELCKPVGMTPIPSILLRIYFHGYERIFSDFKNFRYNFYRITDQDKFTVVDLREITAKPLEKIHSNPSCNAVQH